LLHASAVDLLNALLTYWARHQDDVQIARNLAIRWEEREPRIGIDPDVCVLSPAPPHEGNLRSVRTWMAGHHPPLVAIEVVSETNPHKDYAIAPDKYAVSGTRELWIFDPTMSGPTSHGGPFRLQVWRREEDGRFARVHEGEGPYFSATMSAHLVVLEGGTKLRLADDAAGKSLWPTGEEAALARVAELEAQLAAIDRRPGR
jgi:hypothetical protein